MGLQNYFSRPGLVLGLIASLGLSSCAMVPGMSGSAMREQSSVPLPVKQNDEVIPANVAVKAITAELIVEQKKARQLQLPAAAKPAPGKLTAAPIDPNTQYLDYKLGPGDIINVTVWDHPELTIPAGSYRSAEASGTLVAENGTIFYPYAGIIQVSGLTVREVRDILIKKLATYIEKVQLDVRVVSFRSKRIYVVGEVAKAGLLEINDIPMTMLEAVNRAGGFTTEADHANVLLTRAGQTYRVDLQALYEDGATGQNIRLEPGDIVNVPDRQQNKIFVLGEVTKPGSYLMNKRRSTLAEALGDAGFVNPLTSNPGWIYVMRGNTDAPELFHLNASSPDALLLADRFPLQPRDIVYVDVADVARWNRVISNILPTATMLNTISQTQYPLFGGRQP
ncbi:polysaccharide biosynthesis/export family protein [Azoarcus sp. L1K30]|uniref:polysaccharide export protein n=1 Tax=Azoarcus sp. L1K30 TaxID=2820277 RepID=UPI001B82903F|nr:polysaccharide export protein [Azoarcus sp. L1K30]MBR0564501.1 polysaccharide biosynthesis/export family protein [Azoarcus sp. L1K30]